MNNLEKIVFKLIDKKTADCDKYNNNGSLWLIFTDKKRWVLEYTNQDVLWYNYTFFNDIFSWLGLTDKKNEYITKWFESRFLGIGVKHTRELPLRCSELIEDTIQNGVKRTVHESIADSFAIEDTIQNGVKLTTQHKIIIPFAVEDTIKNGVKEIYSTLRRTILGVDDILKNGIKETKSMGGKRNGRVDNTIQNGVKHCEDGDWLDGDERIDEIIENGVKQ
jgi:hypothetical protein